MMKRIFPIFVVAAPALVLIAYAQYGAGVRHPEPPAPAQQTSDPPTAGVAAGRALFLKNCAHCHGADAHGDEGPDLHNLDWTDQQIAARIRNGKKGRMTAFHDKLNEEQINALIAYLRSLK